MHWDDINARARGLATHLLDARALSGLASSSDWTTFLARVTSLGYPLDHVSGALLDPPAFDRAVTRVAAARLALLERWLAGRRAVLAVVFEDESRRTVRALLRGVVQGASPGARLRLVTPTPTLPLRALEHLASASTVAELAREFVRLGHPAGRVLEEALRTPSTPDLRTLEWRLTRMFSQRAVRSARPGGMPVRRFAAELVDESNLWTLLLAAPLDSGAAPDSEFLPGGARVTKELFTRLRVERDGDRLLKAVRAALAATPLGVALAQDPLDLASIEARAAASRIVWLRGAARRDPLGPAVVLSVLERIRAEARALRAIAWGVALGAGGPTLTRWFPEAA